MRLLMIPVVGVLLLHGAYANANSYQCEVSSYSGALAAVNPNSTSKLKIIKGFIPERFSINDEHLKFAGWVSMPLERKPSNGVYHITYKAKFTNGQQHQLRYRVNINDDLKGKISMQMQQKVNLGPVAIKCLRD